MEGSRRDVAGWRELSLVLGVSLAACDSRVVTRLDLGALDVQYGFMVVLDAGRAPTRVTAPFGLEGGVLRFGSLPAVELEAGERSMVVVALDDAALSAGVGGFEPARASELGVAIQAPPPAPAILGDSPGVKVAAIPPGARWLVADVEAGGDAPLEPLDSASQGLREQLALTVPVDPEHCRVPGQTASSPYTSTERVFAGLPAGRGTRVANGIRDLVRLDPERHVIMTLTHVAVVELGRALELEHLVELPGTNLLDPAAIGAEAIALDPLPTQDGRVRIVVVGSVPQTEAHPLPPDGRIWELTVDGSSIAVSATEVVEDTPTAVAIAADGSTFVGLLGGRVTSWARGAPAPGEVTQLEKYYFDGRDRTHLLSTGDLETPILAGTRGRLHLYDRSANRWRYEMLFQDGFASGELLDFLALAVAPRQSEDEPLELWAGAQRGNLFRKVEGTAWERVTPSYPPRFEPCGQIDPERGEVVFQERFLDAMITDRYVHLTLLACSAVLQLRREDRCASLLGAPTEGVARTVEDLYGIDASEGRVVVGGAWGRMFTATWPPAR